jgi:hypothetical protein
VFVCHYERFLSSQRVAASRAWKTQRISESIYTAVRSQILGHVPQRPVWFPVSVTHKCNTPKHASSREMCCILFDLCVSLSFSNVEKVWKGKGKKKERSRSCSAYLFRCCAAPRAPSGEFSSFRLLLLAGYARCRLDPINLLKKARTASASTPHLPLRRRSQGKKNTRGARKQTSMTSLNVE